MAMKRCPVCGERYSDTYKNCPFCEEDEYWEEEEDTRRPLFREGGRGSSRSSYGIVTPILIVLIVLMAALLIYLLYGDKITGMFSKDPGTDQPGIQEPQNPDPDPTPTPDPSPDDGEEPEDGTQPGGEDTPDDGEMPEGSGSNAGSTGSTSSSGTSGGMSYASAAALPGGLTLSSTDFTRKVSEGDVKLRVSGGTGSYTWISENTAIATVSSDGMVTPVASGTTNVVVTDGTKKAICIVRVTGGSAPASTGSSGTTTGSTSTSSGGSLKTGNAVVVNGGNGVRVRSGPGTTYDVLATIPNGGSVRIVESAGSDWYKITFTASGGVTTTGYMKGEFLSNS